MDLYYGPSFITHLFAPSSGLTCSPTSILDTPDDFVQLKVAQILTVLLRQDSSNPLQLSVSDT
jgi:hypothetical protein